MGTGDPELDNITDVIATCLYLVYDPVARRRTAAGAGHPPPAVVTPDGTAEFVDLPVGPPLGVGGLPFEAVEWEVPRGSLLALYTDGLVEVPEHDLGKGMALLRRRLERPAHSLEALCDDLVQTLLPAQPSDDVALLVARTRTLDSGPGRHLGPACRPGRRGGRARRGLPSPGEVGTAGRLPSPQSWW